MPIYRQKPYCPDPRVNDPGIIETIIALVASLLMVTCSLPADTPVHAATRDCREQELNRLIAAGADVQQQVRGNETAIHYSARYLCPQAVQVLLDAGADIDAREQHDMTALHMAALYEPMLADNMQQPCAANDDSCKARQAQQAQLAMVQVLVEAGADLNALDEDGRTALQIALDYDRQQVAELLRQAGAGAKQNNP